VSVSDNATNEDRALDLRDVSGGTSHAHAAQAHKTKWMRPLD